MHKGRGLVAQVYTEASLAALVGHLAIGHNRYSTSGEDGAGHSQPVLGPGAGVALAHNGNLPSTRKLESFLGARGVRTLELNDSEKMTAVLSLLLARGMGLEEALYEAYPLFTGSFSLLVMTRDSLAALKDPCGVKPLAFGRLPDGSWVFSSETCALQTVGASLEREVGPGELLVVDDRGLRSRTLAPGRQRLDVFELVYFARPDSVLLGRSVNAARQDFGARLARESPVSADVVVPVPDSGVQAALGYARESGIPFNHGLIKNRYIHRTFISPGEYLRHWGVRMKLNPLPDVFAGRRVMLIDDSIVRGTTLGGIISMIRCAGAREVHVGICSPPVKYPDFYGIDTPCQEELIAFRMSVREMCAHFGADSLHFLSYPGLLAALGIPESRLCTSCFTGSYPIDLGERAREVRAPSGSARALRGRG